MSLQQRFNDIIAYTKLSVRAFANKCEISQATLDKQIKGLRSISIETVQSVLNTFPEISAEWLLRGEGEMLKSSGGGASVSCDGNSIEAIPPRVLAMIEEKDRQIHR
ncbi:MAG: helix-turn-helix domain-containing protein, partial [Muribaculaceae bacterium]|nr:helix-turn-helix domain-containing protein [Muribaculaceae bacterium]